MVVFRKAMASLRTSPTLVLLLMLLPLSAPMAPKASIEQPKVVLGRPGTNLKVGLVGLPNVGKSTFFNILCSMAVPAENYPFCTIDPSVSRVNVPDERFDWLCEHYKTNSKVPANLQVTDIAGLVKGAAEGAGLGNAFLSHIQATDCIFHVLRVFEDANIVHVDDEVNPVRDMEVISNELRSKDSQFVEKSLETTQKEIQKKSGKPGSPEHKKLDLMNKVKDLLATGKDVRQGDWHCLDVEILNTLQLLTAKPLIFLLNMGEEDFIKKKNKWLPKIKEYLDKTGGGQMIPMSCALEAKLSAMSAEEQATFCKENKIQSALPKIIKAGTTALSMDCFFTCGPGEVKAWGMRTGTKAPQAAGVIHTDFEKGFIMADTMSFEDIKKHGGEAACKAAGKFKANGKEYVVQDGDVIHFKFNVASGGKAAEVKKKSSRCS